MLTYSIVVTLVVFILVFLYAMGLKERSNEETGFMKHLHELSTELDEARHQATQAHDKARRAVHDKLTMESRLEDMERKTARIEEESEHNRKALQMYHRMTDKANQMTSIKFTANIPLVGWTPTEFKLGLGPCGKSVDSLSMKELDDRYEITQVCTDRTTKTFTYLKTDVMGRIEIGSKPRARSIAHVTPDDSVIVVSQWNDEKACWVTGITDNRKDHQRK